MANPPDRHRGEEATSAAGPAPADGGRAGLAWLERLAIAALTALAYANTLDAAFHLDDLDAIVGNPALRDLGRLWPPGGNRWLGYLTFALNYQAGALDVRGYHLVNVAIHVGCGLLVHALAAVVLRTPRLAAAGAGPLLRRWLPLTAGLLFALHPLATQAVTYVVQRFTSLATLLFLGAAVAWLWARLARAGGAAAPGRWRPGGPLLLLLSALLAAGAMATKEIAFTLPVVLLGCELLLFEGGSPRRFLPLVPVAATALIVPLGHVTGLAGLASLPAETPDIGRLDYLLTQSRVVVTYLRLLVAPFRQNLDPDVAVSRSPLEPEVLLSVAVLLAVAGLAVAALVAARRARRAEGVLVFLGTAWFFVTLSVESSIIPIRDVMVEHRVYLPAAGAALALGTALLVAVEALRLRAPAPAQVGVALLLTAGPLGVATAARNEVWRDGLTLWGDTVAKSPAKARPHAFLGLALHEAGRTDEAIAELLTALRLRPRYPEALGHLGNAYLARSDFERARQAFARQVELTPWEPIARNNLGVACEFSGRIEEARREYQEALRLAPGMALAASNLRRVELRRRLEQSGSFGAGRP